MFQYFCVLWYASGMTAVVSPCMLCRLLERQALRHCSFKLFCLHYNGWHDNTARMAGSKSRIFKAYVVCVAMYFLSHLPTCLHLIPLPLCPTSFSVDRAPHLEFHVLISCGLQHLENSSLFCRRLTTFLPSLCSFCVMVMCQLSSPQVAISVCFLHTPAFVLGHSFINLWV